MPEKFYITSENKVIIKCPKCSKTSPTDAKQFITSKREVKGKIKCPCGESFSFVIERRKNFRKQISIPGRYKITAPSSKSTTGNMVVKDISKTGLKITPIGSCTFLEGDKLLLEFKLDDKQFTEIKIEGVVVNVMGNQIGVKFCIKDPYDPNLKAIGFYLF